VGSKRMPTFAYRKSINKQNKTINGYGIKEVF
jgi:hypothetical protein